MTTQERTESRRRITNLYQCGMNMTEISQHLEVKYQFVVEQIVSNVESRIVKFRFDRRLISNEPDVFNGVIKIELSGKRESLHPDEMDYGKPFDQCDKNQLSESELVIYKKG